jgi:hypothetical protein
VLDLPGNAERLFGPLQIGQDVSQAEGEVVVARVFSPSLICLRQDRVFRHGPVRLQGLTVIFQMLPQIAYPLV